MATEIYLGNPPPHIVEWIKNHSQPVVTFTFASTNAGLSGEYEGGIMNSSIFQNIRIYDNQSETSTPLVGDVAYPKDMLVLANKEWADENEFPSGSAAYTIDANSNYVDLEQLDIITIDNVEYYMYTINISSPTTIYVVAV